MACKSIKSIKVRKFFLTLILLNRSFKRKCWLVAHSISEVPAHKKTLEHWFSSQLLSLISVSGKRKLTLASRFSVLTKTQFPGFGRVYVVPRPRTFGMKWCLCSDVYSEVFQFRAVNVDLMHFTSPSVMGDVPCNIAAWMRFMPGLCCAIFFSTPFSVALVSRVVWKIRRGTFATARISGYWIVSFPWSAISSRAVSFQKLYSIILNLKCTCIPAFWACL